MEFKELVGKRLKTIRLYGDYKQKDLAGLLKIKPSQLSLYEQGKREPSISFVKDFCDFFDMSLSHFFTFEENENVDIRDESQKLIKDLNKIIIDLEKLEINRTKGKQIVLLSSKS